MMGASRSSKVLSMTDEALVMAEASLMEKSKASCSSFDLQMVGRSRPLSKFSNPGMLVTGLSMSSAQAHKNIAKDIWVGLAILGLC